MQEISSETVIQAAKGNAEAFEAIYRAYSGFVYNVAYRVVNRFEDAQEITQDVFLTVYRKLGSFQFKSSFRTWIYRIAVNSAINYAKKRSKEMNRTVEFDENMGLMSGGNPVYEKIDRDHREKIVTALLGALNPDQRACLVLRDLEGLSYEEIARTLKVNLNTVRSRLKRAREKLMAISKGVVKNEL